MTATNESAIDRIFHALGDPTRMAMVKRLAEGPVSVSQLAEPFGMTLAGVMQHLEVLEACGLARTEKVGRVRTCSLNPAELPAAALWIGDRLAAWDQRRGTASEIRAEAEEETRVEVEPEPEWLG